eukprot:8662042-Pyramimonas_sp.AAC.1
MRAAEDTVSNWRELFVLLEQMSKDHGTLAAIGKCWRSPWFWHTIPIALRLHRAANDFIDGNDLGISKLTDATRDARAALRAAGTDVRDLLASGAPPSWQSAVMKTMCGGGITSSRLSTQGGPRNR